MHPGNRRMLRPRVRVDLPAGVEQDQQWTDPVPIRNGQELIQPLEKAGAVGRPQLILQKDPHCVHARCLRQRKLPVDQLRVERRRLKHLELVDCVRRNVVCPNKPGLLGVPRCGLVFCPALPRLRTGARTGAKHHEKRTQQQTQRGHGSPCVSPSVIKQAARPLLRQAGCTLHREPRLGLRLGLPGLR